MVASARSIDLSPRSFTRAHKKSCRDIRTGATLTRRAYKQHEAGMRREPRPHQEQAHDYHDRTYAASVLFVPMSPTPPTVISSVPTNSVFQSPCHRRAAWSCHHYNHNLHTPARRGQVMASLATRDGPVR